MFRIAHYWLKTNMEWKYPYLNLLEGVQYENLISEWNMH